MNSRCRPSPQSIPSVAQPGKTNKDGWEADWDVSDAGMDAAADELVTPREDVTKWANDATTPMAIGGKQSTLPSTMPSPSLLAEGGASSWAWGSALLSAASGGLHSLTEGLNEVIDTVHTAVNLPSPEELAKLPYEQKVQLEHMVDDVKESWPPSDHDDCDSAMEEEEAAADDERKHVHKCSSKRHLNTAAEDLTPRAPPHKQRQQGSGFGMFGLSSLVTNSLDILETVGKKTFNALTIEETDVTPNDPSTSRRGGRRRFILSSAGGPTLSSVLRERKEEGNEYDDTGSTAGSLEHGSHYCVAFERYDGLVQLEGLEMVSGSAARHLKAAKHVAQSDLDDVQSRLILDDDDDVSNSASGDGA